VTKSELTLEIKEVTEFFPSAKYTDAFIDILYDEIGDLSVYEFAKAKKMIYKESMYAPKFRDFMTTAKWVRGQQEKPLPGYEGCRWCKDTGITKAICNFEGYEHMIFTDEREQNQWDLKGGFGKTTVGRTFNFICDCGIQPNDERAVTQWAERYNGGYSRVLYGSPMDHEVTRDLDVRDINADVREFE